LAETRYYHALVAHKGTASRGTLGSSGLVQGPAPPGAVG